MRLALAALVALLALPGYAAEIEYYPAQTPAPIAIAASGDALLVLDAANGVILGGNPKAGLEAIELAGRPRGAGGDEKGQTVVVTGDSTAGWRANILSGGRKLRSFQLKPTVPVTSVTDVATKNEIIWLLQQNPPLVALFGADGAELARADLSSVCRAPFSLALGPSGEGFVADPLGSAVIELNAFGQFKAAHKLAGTGFTRPTGIAAGMGGRIWISDTILGEVAAFTMQNRVLTRDASVAATAVEDPTRLATATDKLWALSGWNAKIARIPTR